MLEKYHDEADETERLAVARGILTHHAIAIASDWLVGNGYEVERSSPEFRVFALKFIKAQTQATKGMKQRQEGIPVETIPAPTKIQREDNQGLNTLEKLRDYWLTQPSETTGGKKGRTSEAEANTVIKKFRDYVGDLKPNEITDEHMVQLKDKMLASGSSNATINKSRGVLGAMFNMARKNRKLAINPCADMKKLPIPLGEVEKPYTIQELSTIFNSPVFTHGERLKRFEGDATYWMPLLGLYTGARLNELGQLYTEDFGEEEGINYIVNVSYFQNL